MTDPTNVVLSTRNIIQLDIPYFGIKSQLFSFFIVERGNYLIRNIIIKLRKYQATYTNSHFSRDEARCSLLPRH